MKKNKAQLKVLTKVALALTSKISLTDVLEEIFQQTKLLIPYSACNINLIEKGKIYNVYSIGYDKYGGKKFVNSFAHLLEELPLEKKTIEKARPLLISDTYKNHQWIIFKETSWIKSRLSMPICIKGRVIGLLNLDSHIPGKFKKGDIKKLQPLVNIAAVALENTRLFEKFQQALTEYQKIEGALVESEERYRTLFENTGTAMIIIEEDTTISMINKEGEKLSGYTKDEIENKMKWTEFIVPEDLERMKKYHSERKKAEDEAPTEYEFRLIDKKGRVKDIFVRIVVIPNTKKSIASLTDITKRKHAEERIKKTMNAAIDSMSKIIETRDPYTSGHQHKVCQLAVTLAQELGLFEDKIEGIRIASLIHDIGKIGLPTEILSKPTELTNVEFSLIKGHSQVGYDILKSIEFPYPIAQIILQHHERLDGSGYPQGLKGEEILLEARILGVADVVEAMSSHRPYRPALGIDKALEEISQNRGILYDPEVVDACLKLFGKKGFTFK